MFYVIRAGEHTELIDTGLDGDRFSLSRHELWTVQSEIEALADEPWRTLYWLHSQDTDAYVIGIPTENVPRGLWLLHHHQVARTGAYDHSQVGL